MDQQFKKRVNTFDIDVRGWSRMIVRLKLIKYAFYNATELY